MFSLSAQKVFKYTCNLILIYDFTIFKIGCLNVFCNRMADYAENFLTISNCSIWLTSNVIYGDIISSSPHVKEPSVTAHYEHYAHDVWSIRHLLHW
jgi:hypothetical protein